MVKLREFYDFIKVSLNFFIKFLEYLVCMEFSVWLAGKC